MSKSTDCSAEAAAEGVQRVQNSSPTRAAGQGDTSKEMNDSLRPRTTGIRYKLSPLVTLVEKLHRFSWLFTRLVLGFLISFSASPAKFHDAE